MANMSLLVALVFTFFFSIPVLRAQAVPDEKLDKLYKTITSHQISTHPKNIDKLYAGIQAAKTNYGKDFNQPKYIDVPINLTVYHRYEDLDQIGKTMPLMFANQGPSSAIFRKKQQPDIPICGCTEAAVPGERRICVNSLQQMLEFVSTLMGSHIKPLFTYAAKWQIYAITGKATMVSNDTIGCHKSNDVRAVAVYHCHHIDNSIVRVVPLMGDDGLALRVYSVCHMNTSSWNPTHIVFQILKAKPGVPVCHFLTTDDIVWVKE